MKEIETFLNSQLFFFYNTCLLFNDRLKSTPDNTFAFIVTGNRE